MQFRKEILAFMYCQNACVWEPYFAQAAVFVLWHYTKSRVQDSRLTLPCLAQLCHAAVQTLSFCCQRAVFLSFQMLSNKLLQHMCSHALDCIAIWQYSVVLGNCVLFTHAFLKVKKSHKASTNHDFLFNTFNTSLLWWILSSLCWLSDLQLIQYL